MILPKDRDALPGQQYLYFMSLLTYNSKDDFDGGVGPGAIAFHTRTKTVSARWPDANPTKVDLVFPVSK